MANDRIADMLTRMRNANLARHQIVQVPLTKVTKNIKLFLLISLKYKGKNRYPVLTALKRVSKPGLRVYANHKELPRVLGGLGIAVISTSKGIMTDRSARNNGLGGEVLCYIW
uniref:ribosomal protein S8 n=1 Tax=Pseudoerythrocladia kornmannii TaxID=753682 RepID=UPI001BEED37D|nr:ribosomal protein S8 [Pseudoerythrocladia kornmannii]QUE28272.1 ribosomal protein S8 [Pseudoerythrocladia kornmannii]UNJ16777.1 ribosomal protein S8 [Pseudoerythrocladia kornmannii]